MMTRVVQDTHNSMLMAMGIIALVMVYMSQFISMKISLFAVCMVGDMVQLSVPHITLLVLSF